MTFSRSALLHWLRNVAPDLRIGKALQNGRRVCFARFTCMDEEHEVLAEGDDPDDEIVRLAVDAARKTLGMTPIDAGPRDLRIEQAIVRASLEGDDARRDSLTRQLFASRAGGTP